MNQFIRTFITKSSRGLTPLLACLLLAISHSVYAHQQKLAYIKVLFNPNTNNIEVMHRFSLHDAEHAVYEIFGKQADIIGSESTQQTFTRYVVDNFNLHTSPKSLIPLETVGYELDGLYFWVYQEMPIPSALTKITLSHNALRDIWPDQVNRVNIEIGKEVQTLIFGENITNLSAPIKIK
ncbi:DUF6702 family protein [Alteromonas sp. a30]|uniref:DUF6702 family protein n=1 Tax=Alteromonas sp. a30 TaxID=2730917 RepID=UPI0022818BC1|nr:DUF6702 family protein [Alteromonas sp. a30]MCY7294844.1 hypothetical protein [Alteromonas sp. a30]